MLEAFEYICCSVRIHVTFLGTDEKYICPWVEMCSLQSSLIYKTCIE